MSYGLILSTLREFDLITEEQMETAWAEHQRSIVEYRERQDEFHAEWKTTHPWWKRLWSDWLSDWYEHEKEIA